MLLLASDLFTATYFKDIIKGIEFLDLHPFW